MSYLSHAENHVSTLHKEDGIHYVHTQFHDDEALEKIRRLRDSEILQKAKLGLHEGEDLRAAFSFPSVMQFNLFKKKNPEIWALINSPSETERIRGSGKLAILHPEYVVQQRL